MTDAALAAPTEASRASSAPGLSVIMPVRNEEAFIERAIASIVEAGERVDGAAIHRAAGYEIIVVDGMSDDRTREIVAGLHGTTPHLSLLDNPARTVPHAMNIGIRAAKGEVVIRLDGHAEMTPDFIAACLRELAAHPECACVGGPIQNVDLDESAAVISAAMSSPFGVGNARFRTGGAEGYVDTLAFGAYRKDDLFAIGLFDEDLVRNQDDELNYRLVASGRRIWFSHAIESRYFVRSSLRKLARQYFQYGYWKVFVNRKHGVVTNFRQLAPPLLVLTVALLTLAGLFVHEARLLLLFLIVSYLAGAAMFAWRTNEPARRLPGIIAAFCTLHASYGLGYLAGVRDFLVLRRGASARSAELSR